MLASTLCGARAIDSFARAALPFNVRSPRRSGGRKRVLPPLYLIPTTIESGPTRCSTKVFRKPVFFIHPVQSAPE
jgi:hypothetical protein